MGMILLDLEFRFEKTFKISIPSNWPEHLGMVNSGDDATLPAVLEYLLRQCREQGVAQLEDAWSLLVKVICDATGAKAIDLTPDTLLIRDIAPFG